MKKLALMTCSLLVLGGIAQAQTPTTTTTTTTTETPAGSTTTTTDVTAPAPAPAPAPVIEPTARDAITGKPVDANAALDTTNERPSLRDKVRARISEEAEVKQ